MSQARIEQTDHGYQFVKDEFHIELTEDDLATLSKSANHILSLILQQNSRLSSGLRAVSALETQSVTIGRDTDQIFLTFHFASVSCRRVRANATTASPNV
jgi:hypothetical protein